MRYLYLYILSHPLLPIPNLTHPPSYHTHPYSNQIEFLSLGSLSTLSSGPAPLGGSEAHPRSSPPATIPPLFPAVIPAEFNSPSLPAEENRFVGEEEVVVGVWVVVLEVAVVVLGVVLVECEEVEDDSLGKVEEAPGIGVEYREMPGEEKVDGDNGAAMAPQPSMPTNSEVGLMGVGLMGATARVVVVVVVALTIKRGEF